MRRCPLLAIWLATQSLVLCDISAGQDFLVKRIAVRQVADMTFGLLDVCGEAGIPCGVELLTFGHPIRGGHGDRTTSRMTASVKSHLDRIVARHPQYRWGIAGGVVNLSPKANIDNGGKRVSPLGRTIAVVDIDAEPLNDAAVEICRSAGVSCEREGETIAGQASKNWERRMTLHLRGVSFRDALNELIRKDGHSVWVFWPGDEVAVNPMSAWVRFEEFVRSRINKVLGRSQARWVRYSEKTHVLIIEQDTRR